MTLVRWQPFREIETLQNEMNRLFNSVMPTGQFSYEMGTYYAPALELQETSEAIILKLEVPGLEAKDLDVEVTPEAVSIKGERREESKTEEKEVTRSEFRYGYFQRVIPLPALVQNDKVEAEYKNGILHLNLPKAEAEKNKVVKVHLN